MKMPKVRKEKKSKGAGAVKQGYFIIIITQCLVLCFATLLIFLPLKS